MGLGIAYAGSAREDLLELLAPLLSESAASAELVGAAAAAIGLVFVGSASGDVSSELLQVAARTCACRPRPPRPAAVVGAVWAARSGVGGGASRRAAQALLMRTADQLKDGHARYIMLGLALTFLGRQEAAEPTLEGLKVRLGGGDGRRQSRARIHRAATG
jgi:26S proteasome regulatory subunit N1